MNKSFVKNPEAVKEILNIQRIPRFRSLTSTSKFVTKRMFWVYGIRSEGINRGYCFIWAYLVAAIYPNPLKYVSNDGHVVLQDPITEKYFDSEHPSGSENIDDFCAMDCCFYDPPQTVSHQAMTWFWSCVGRQKHLFREIVEKIDPTDLVAAHNRGLVRCDNYIYNLNDAENWVAEQQNQQTCLNFS